MILDGSHALTAPSSAAAEREARRTPGEQGTPLAEFPWSDSIVGIGFFPQEVALPDGWRPERRR
jgi:hypothetical protein